MRGAESILCSLEREGLLFPELQLQMENGSPKQIGKGGCSVVYEMSDRKEPARKYALKVIGFGNQTVTEEVFARTTALQRALSRDCPYVVEILETKELMVSAGGEERPLFLILMKRLEAVIRKDLFGNPSLGIGALSEESGIRVFVAQIGQAVLAAHDRNILHRDIKLENIFWDAENGRYQLGDFGIAKLAETGSADTVVFTDGYGAPEIEYGLSESYNATADIYSLGITLYLLLNRLRFPGSEDYCARRIQYTEDFVFPLPEGASAGLVRIIRKMCSFRSEDRYQSMADVLSELEMAENIAEEQQADTGDTGALTETCDSETDLFEKTTVGEQSRQYRKKRQKITERYYAGVSRGLLVGASILTALFLGGLSAETAAFSEWRVAFSAAAVLAEAVFLGLGEFQISSRILAAVLVAYCAWTDSSLIPYGVLFAGAFSGVPIFAAASALGTGIWIFLEHAGGVHWLELVWHWESSWLFGALLLAAADNYLILRCYIGKTKKRGYYLWNCMMCILPFVLFAAGIVLFFLQQREMTEIPSALTRLHMSRMGLVLLICELYQYWAGGREKEYVSGN